MGFSLRGGPAPKAQKKQGKQKCAAPASITASDLLESGLEFNIRTYFAKGWCDGAGQPLPEYETSYAAALALAWHRLGFTHEFALDILLALEHRITLHLADKLDWQSALPKPLRHSLLNWAELAASTHEQVVRWFSPIAPTLHRYSDLRALCLHLAAVAHYMEDRQSLELLSRLRRTGGAGSPKEHAMHLVARRVLTEEQAVLLTEDPAYRQYIAGLLQIPDGEPPALLS